MKNSEGPFLPPTGTPEERRAAVWYFYVPLVVVIGVLLALSVRAHLPKHAGCLVYPEARECR